MNHLILNAELQTICLAIERMSQQLSTLSLSPHPYQPLLFLLQRNTLEVCGVMRQDKSEGYFITSKARIQELKLFIGFLRDYAFEGVQDEKIDSHLTQIKEGLEHSLALIAHIATNTAPLSGSA